MLGKMLNHYEILAPLGAGGMGEVYRARDTKLDREVAIKVLPEPVANDAQRMARFQREAQVLASLNHPNIGAIYGLEKAGDVAALVLELIEGSTLEERLAGGALSQDETFDIALQIATALEAAHEVSVVHRDLKPANVKIDERPDGRRVKVLDFGLAKGFEDAGNSGSAANSPTLSLAATQAGMILGTAAYMSPEQARGVAVDKRADIWSFGVVLFEMLSGDQLFGGDTVSDTLADVLRAELDFDALPADTPGSVVGLLRRCLVRDPMRRLRDIGEARIALETATAEGDAAPDSVVSDRAAPGRSSGTGGAGASGAPRPSAAAPTGGVAARFGGLRSALVVLVAGVVALMAYAVGRNAGAPPAPAAETIKLGFVVDELDAVAPVISPDGRHIAYSSGNDLYVRSLAESAAVHIVENADARHLFWKPDSTAIGYLSGQQVWRVDIDGSGHAELGRIGEGLVGGAGGAWTPDGRIVYSQGNTGFLQVPERGGVPTDFLLPKNPDSGGHFHEPSLLPDGELVFVFHPVNRSADTISVSHDGTYDDVLTLSGDRLTQPRYAPSGYILFLRNEVMEGVWAVPFDLATRQTTGEPFPVASRGGPPSVADDGTLAHSPGLRYTARQLVWVDRDGNVGEPVVDDSRGVSNLALSPDGARVVFSQDPQGQRDLYVHDLTRGTTERLTYTANEEWELDWFADGRRLLFAKNVEGLLEVTYLDLDRPGEERKIVTGGNPDVAPDQKSLIYATFGLGGTADISHVDLEGGEPQALLDADGLQDYPAFSPDGKWVAYESNELGSKQVYVTDFPDARTRRQVSTDGGAMPHWSASGESLFFLNGEIVMEARVEVAEGQLRVATPQALFDGAALGVYPSLGYDVDPDGSRFLMPSSPLNLTERGEVAIVFNWFAEFRD